MTIKKAVIPCGGCGTRFLPITKAVAKEMLPIVDRPCLDYIVDELVDSGIEEICIIVSPEKPEIERFYTENRYLTARLRSAGKQELAEALNRYETKARFTYVVQEEAKGSGHALLYAEEFCAGEPFVVSNGDDLTVASRPVTRQLIDAYERFGKTVIGVQRREPPEIYRYGVIRVVEELGKGSYAMDGIAEKPKPGEPLASNFASLGRYVATPEIFEYIKKTPWAANGELQFTDALNLLATERGAVAHVFEGKRYDIGDKLGSLQAIVELALARSDLGEAFRSYLKRLDLN